MKFSERLQGLGFATYSDYLASDRWKQFKRLYCSSGGQRTCCVCSIKPVQLHHQTYQRLGCELLTDVVPLCRQHHAAVHEWLKTSGKRFVEFTNEAVVALGGKMPRPPKGPAKDGGRKKKRNPTEQELRKQRGHEIRMWLDRKAGLRAAREMRKQPASVYRDKKEVKLGTLKFLTNGRKTAGPNAKPTIF